MSTTRSTRETARFRVESEDGQQLTISELTTFLVVQPLSGPASPPIPERISYRCGPSPVNLNDDGSFDVLTAGSTPVRCRRA